MRLPSVILALLSLCGPGFGAATWVGIQEDVHPRMVTSGDTVLPQIVAGGSWQTTIYLVNMTSSTMSFSLFFYDDNGNSLGLPFRTTAGDIQRFSRIDFQLDGYTNFTFTAQDVDPAPLQGWAVLSYDASFGRIGGFAVFRQHVPGSPNYEASVPLDNLNDYKFFLPFNNTQGFSTGLALVNAATNLPAHVLMKFMDVNGNEILSTILTLPVNGHAAFSIPATYPQLNGRIGTLYVQSDTNMLSGLGLRFDNSGPFTTLPILNWPGMFP